MIDPRVRQGPTSYQSYNNIFIKIGVLGDLDKEYRMILR